MVWRKGLGKAQVGREGGRKEGKEGEKGDSAPQHRNYRRSRTQALLPSLSPSLPQAAKDILAKVPLLNGKEAKVEVKAGSVPTSGAVLSLRQKGGGMPKKVREGGRKGGSE